jgi:hypothetical protein
MERGDSRGPVVLEVVAIKHHRFIGAVPIIQAAAIRES